MELLPRNIDDTLHKPRVIGVIGAIRTPEVGYMIHTDFWGQGYASEALQAFIPVFFEHYSGKERYGLQKPMLILNIFPVEKSWKRPASCCWR